jgi:hypothetical protein
MVVIQLLVSPFLSTTCKESFQFKTNIHFIMTSNNLKHLVILKKQIMEHEYPFNRLTIKYICLVITF